MNTLKLLLAAAALVGLAACSKSEPNNAMTRYAEGLAQDQQQAQPGCNSMSANLVHHVITYYRVRGAHESIKPGAQAPGTRSRDQLQPAERATAVACT
jgi:uncharacterized lipoprotein